MYAQFHIPHTDRIVIEINDLNDEFPTTSLGIDYLEKHDCVPSFFLTH